jgi:outer membrane protein assembly factor BamB
MTKTLIKICILFVLFSACKNNAKKNETNSENWNLFRGNPALTAYANVSLPDNPVLLWTFQSGSNTRSSPIVYNQIAYWSDRRGRIFGVDIDGKQVFDYAMNTATDAIPMIHDGMLYIGRIDGFLYAICLEKQDTVWTFETFGQIMASPNRMNFRGKDAIIVGSYDNYLYIINSENGSEINRFESGYYINGAVAIGRGEACLTSTIVYGGCDGWIRVIDALSGIQTDSLDVDGYIPASPAISRNFVYIADHSGTIHELKLNNGKILSYQKIILSTSENLRQTSVPAVSEQMVFVVSDDRHVYAINRKNNSIAWKHLLKGDTGESSPVICSDKLIVCTRDGIVSILDTKTGKLFWEYDTGEQILGSPAVINGYFYVLTFRGNLFCFGRK